MRTSPDRAAVLAARAWLEDGDPGRLRVRMTTTADVTEGDSRTVVVMTVDSACEVVREWLEALLARGGQRG
jgi:hypothetical protein